MAKRFRWMSAVTASHFRKDGRAKVPYPSKEAAEKAIGRNASQVHGYHCEFCGNWHLGHVSTAQAKAKTLRL